MIYQPKTAGAMIWNAEIVASASFIEFTVYVVVRDYKIIDHQIVGFMVITQNLDINLN